jgi:hypothetical protein
MSLNYKNASLVYDQFRKNENVGTFGDGTYFLCLFADTAADIAAQKTTGEKTEPEVLKENFKNDLYSSQQGYQRTYAVRRLITEITGPLMKDTGIDGRAEFRKELCEKTDMDESKADKMIDSLYYASLGVGSPLFGQIKSPSWGQKINDYGMIGNLSKINSLDDENEADNEAKQSIIDAAQVSTERLQAVRENRKRFKAYVHN